MAHPYGSDTQVARAAGVASSLSKDVLAKHAADVDTNARFPQESLAALVKSGLLGLGVPKEFGGTGEGPRAFAAVAEELAMGCGSTAMIYVMHVTATQAIASSSLLAQRGQVLRDIASGAHLTTLAFSEKGSRSQFWAPVSSMAERNGDLITRASKSWVTAANHAHSYVSSSQRPGAASPLESTVYLLGTREAGVRVANRFDGLGLRGNDSAPVELEDVVIPKGNLISAQGDGATTMLQVVLPWFSIGTAAMANGLCRAAVGATAAHLSGTGFTHTGTQLRDLPNLRARLAEMSVRTEQSRTLLGYTLGEVESPSETTPLFVLQSRLAALEAAADVSDLAMKACGGAAFSRHLGIERIFRDARAGWVMAPTVDHLQDFIGKALTGLPLF
jgi:alkylation response protein AidB-like acyl-CoA dehydrogenase